MKITVSQSSASSEQEIKAIIQLANQYYNEENASSFYSLVDAGPDKTEAVANMNSQFGQYDIKNTISSLKVLSLTGNEATVHSVEKSVRTGGYYTPDEQYEYLYTLNRQNGSWKISSMDLQESSVLLTREQGMEPAVLPQGAQTDIKNTLSKYYQGMNDRNIDAVLAVMTSYGEENDNSYKDELRDYFISYELSYAVSASNVFYYSADEAAVYTKVAITDGESKETYTESLILLFSKSENGAWTIDNTYHISFN